jgi:hypothetical protein
VCIIAGSVMKITHLPLSISSLIVLSLACSLPSCRSSSIIPEPKVFESRDLCQGDLKSLVDEATG